MPNLDYIIDVCRAFSVSGEVVPPIRFTLRPAAFNKALKMIEAVNNHDFEVSSNKQLITHPDVILVKAPSIQEQRRLRKAAEKTRKKAAPVVPPKVPEPPPVPPENPGKDCQV